jgi:hypothetical protein
MTGPLLTLGQAPVALRIALSKLSAFRTGLVTVDGQDWPVGSAASLTFSDGTKWAAQLTGPQLAWSKTAAQVASLLSSLGVGASGSPVELWFTPAGSDPILWGVGTVAVYGDGTLGP